MELLSGYSDAGINAFNAGQNAFQNNLMNNISNQMYNQQNQMAMWNAQSAAMAQPTPPGYGEVHLPYLSGSFGPAAAPGTYSPGSGLSSFSGVSLGGGGGYPAATDYPEFGYGGGGGTYTSQAQADAAAGYRAPMQYGWGHNEGAPYPAAPQAWSMGEFNPQTYGWDHNEGADPFQGQQNFQDLWNDRGRVYQPPFVPSPYGPGGAPTGISPPAQQSFYGGGIFNDQAAADRAAGFNPLAAWAGGTPQGTRGTVPDAQTYMPSGQFGGYLDRYLWGANSGSLGASGLMGGGSDTASLGGWPYGGYVPQGTNSSGGGGIGSDAYFGGQGGMYGSQAMADAAARMRGGQGWTIADIPQAVSQESLANRINQGIYDIGNAGDYYSRLIGGGFGMNMPNPNQALTMQGQGLTGQDLTNPHAYPPGFRMDQQ